MSRPWTSAHVVVVVEGACGLVVAGWFAHLGLSAPGTSGRVLPFALAAAALAVVVVLAPRRWRRARAEPPLRRPVPPATRSPHATGPEAVDRPALSEQGRRELERIVAVLARDGLFAPRVPDAAALEEAVAQWGEPVDVDAVLSGVWEAGYWHPGFRAEDHLGALVEDGWKGEQLPETLRAQVADLAALVGDVLEVRLEALAIEPGGRHVRHRLTLVLGGERRELDYRGAPTWLSTVVHVAVARALRDAGAPVRLAWLPGEQTLRTAALRDGVTVGRLNADLGLTGPGAWEWVDEQEPLVAGEL